MKVTAPGGMEDNALIGMLWELGTTGIVEGGESVCAYFPDGSDLRALLTAYPEALVSPDEEGTAASPAVVAEPVLVGKRFLVVDAHASAQAARGDGRHVLKVDSADAFGSGRHETTQLVIEALEGLPLRGATVLDVGCGTAITSAAAQVLGAASVMGCDIHAGTIGKARRNFPEIDLFLGSVDAIASESIDVLVANITAPVIDTLAAHLARVCRPGGWIVLSGFTADRVPANFAPVSASEKEGWLCWMTTRKGLRRNAPSPASIQPFALEWW